MIWWLVIVGVGQFLVALVFGEVVSQFPVAGGVYPWARRLWGRRWAWMTGWVYLIALLVTIAGVVYGAGPYLALLLEFTPGTGSTVICALIMLAVALALNMLGTKILAMAATIGFAAELRRRPRRRWLAADHRAPPRTFGVLFDTEGRHRAQRRLPLGVPRGRRSSASTSTTGSRPAATSPRRCRTRPGVIPKAMRMTIYVGGAASILVCLSLLLAVPDFGAVISGEDADPVISVLNERLRRRPAPSSCWSW